MADMPPTPPNRPPGGDGARPAAPRSGHPFDASQLRAFLAHILDPAAGCVEMRVFHATMERGFVIAAQQFSKTLAGWYDDPQNLVVDASRLQGVSAYVTLNPVRADLLARSDNRLVKAKHTTTDADVVCLRWLYVDIDPVRPADISSTDAEMAAAVARRDEILAAHPEFLPSAIWGRSGNGAWLLIRLPDYPNDEDHRRLVADGLAVLAGRWSDRTVEIDLKTKNPARVMCLCGTLKSKGSNRPERPWRLVTLDSSPGRDLVPLDLDAWVDEYPRGDADGNSDGETDDTATHDAGRRNGSAAGAARRDAREGHQEARQGDDRTMRLYRAARYVERLSGAVSRQDGHGQTFDAACALVKGFDLTPDEARPILHRWNLTCEPPWSDRELEHKLSQADRKPDDKPRGYLFRGDDGRPGGRQGGQANGTGHPADWGPADEWDFEAGTAAEANGHAPPPPADAAQPHGRRPGGPAVAPGPPARDCRPEVEDNPHRLARLVLARRHRHADGLAIRFWREEFHAWSGGSYQPLPRKEVSAEVAGVLAAEFDRIYRAELVQYAMQAGPQAAQAAQVNAVGGPGVGPAAGNAGGGKSKARPPRLHPVTTRLVGDVTQALTDLTLLRVGQCPDQPAWLDRPGPWPAAEVLPARNALVHLPSFVAGRPCTARPTPRFFCSYALDYDFDLDAPEPAEWLAFLAQLWPSDPASIALLQEWMGYLLTPDTSQQKILTMIGPPRSGKGTIANVIGGMIGHRNVVNPTLSGMATPFGLAPLIGKPVAIIGDARISGRTDTAIVVERLLSISGQDSQTIGVKHRSDVTTRLPTRFMIISNELPKIRDASGALAERMIFLRLTRSFLGHEDIGLLGRLLREMPGILNWAIDGWARLQGRGFFVPPKSAKDLAETMSKISSPMKAFLQEYCRTGEGKDPATGHAFLVLSSDLFNKWRTWCQSKGQEHTSDEETFGRDLRAALPGVSRVRRRNDEGRLAYFYAGLRLLEAWEINETEDERREREDGEQNERSEAKETREVCDEWNPDKAF